jgi:TolB-like protein/Tfp pilus assembly protein PilF
VPAVALALILGFTIGVGVLFAWRRNQGAAGVEDGSRVIAVMPFESVGDSADAYFAEGVADEVRTKLARIGGLEVIARGSSIEYRGSAKPPRQVARELGARYLLTGTVRWSKAPAGTSRVRVSAELVEASPDRTPRTRWGENFDAAISDVFQVQADIAGQVAGALHVALEDSLRRSLAARPTQNLDAYDAYLRGKQKFGDVAPARLRATEADFQRAVDLDPRFASAWAALSSVHMLLFRMGGMQVRDAEAAEREMERALALGPNLPETHLAQGSLLELKGDMPGALGAYEAGLRADPSNVDLLSRAAGLKAELGRPEAALLDLQRAARLDPRSPGPAFTMFSIYFGLRRYAEAQAAMDQVRAMVPPGISTIHEEAWLRVAMGDLAGARETLAEAHRIGDSSEVVAYVAIREDLLWLLDDAQQRRVLTLAPADLDGGRADWALALAQTWYRQGDRARARAYGDTANRAYEPLMPHVLNVGDSAQFVGLQALALAYTGDIQAAVRKGEAALSAAKAGPPWQRDYVQFLLARIHVLGGRFDEAVSLLEPLLTSPTSRVSAGYLRINEDFVVLRGNPRFDRLVNGS